MKKLVILRRRKLGMSSVKGICEFSKTGIRWLRNDHKKRLPPQEDELCVRWGCTGNVASKYVVNTALAIHQVNEKGVFRMVCAEAGLAPETWLDFHDVPREILENQGVIVRPASHSRGRKVLFADNEVDLMKAVVQCGVDYYISRYIDKIAEYRVALVSGRVVWVAKKTPANPDDIAWNVAQGGRFDNVRWDDWNLRVVRVATNAFELSELDFGGVDVMVDKDGKAYVIEINSAPSLTSPYRQECFAKAFDYIAEHGKQRIPRIEAKDGYRKFIHPAVCERAKLVE